MCFHSSVSSWHKIDVELDIIQIKLNVDMILINFELRYDSN